MHAPPGPSTAALRPIPRRPAGWRRAPARGLGPRTLLAIPALALALAAAGVPLAVEALRSPPGAHEAVEARALARPGAPGPAAAGREPDGHAAPVAHHPHEPAAGGPRR